MTASLVLCSATANGLPVVASIPLAAALAAVVANTLLRLFKISAPYCL